MAVVFQQLIKSYRLKAVYIHTGIQNILPCGNQRPEVCPRIIMNKLYMYTALAPIPLSTFAGEPSQNVGKSFIKSYCAVCLEGAVIVLSCIIFSLFASSPPVVNPDAAAVTQVWSYVGELLFNMLVLVGAVKMSDRIIREMLGL